MKDRVAVAMALGYADAKTMVSIMETYGLPLPEQVIWLRINHPTLKMDWGGLRHELLRIGIKESAVESRLKEAREFISMKGGVDGTQTVSKELH